MPLELCGCSWFCLLFYFFIKLLIYKTELLIEFNLDGLQE